MLVSFDWFNKDDGEIGQGLLENWNLAFLVPFISIVVMRVISMKKYQLHCNTILQVISDCCLQTIAFVAKTSF